MNWVVNQWYDRGMPVCPVCDKRIDEDQLYIIENTDPVKHYWCVRKK